jgi:transposase
VVAAGLTAQLAEIGQLDRRAIAALAGLAPQAGDSGSWRGRRCIWGGRREVRRALYLAAFVASSHDPELRAVRDRLRAAGKPYKVVAMSKAVPSMCFEAGAPPTARLCSGLR